MTDPEKLQALADRARRLMVDRDQPLTVPELAAYVRVSVKTVMRAIEAGQLEASQLTQSRSGWRIWPAAVDAWMDVRSNRNRERRPLANVKPVNAAAAAAQRARRQGAGSLRVSSDMGRAA